MAAEGRHVGRAAIVGRILGDHSALGLAPRVLVVDRDRASLARVEDALRELCVTPCLHATSGEEALRAARRHGPLLVIMEVHLRAEFDGIRAAERLRDELSLRVVYHTADAELGTVDRAAATDPCGYLLKPARPLELRCALRLALGAAQRVVIERAARSALAPPRHAGGELIARLSAREREVLAMIARGHTSKDIARRLRIAKPTVDTYRSRLAEKLGVKTRSELVGVASDAGLLNVASTGGRWDEQGVVK